MNFRLQPAAAACALLAMSFAHAQTTTLEPVVVTATRVATPLYDSLPSVSVINRAQIERAHAPSLAELLQTQVGVEFGRNGGPGSTTSFFLRGANSTNVVIMVDGVRAAVDGWGNLTAVDMDTDQIERIEVLRGNASALYGEAAIGGVIQITTRGASKQIGGYGSFGLGNRGANGLNLGYNGQSDALTYHLDLGTRASARLSSMDTATKVFANPDADQSRSQFIDLSLQYGLASNARLGAYLRSNSNDLTYDDSQAPSKWSSGTSRNDTNELQRTSNSVGVNFHTKITSDWHARFDLDRTELNQNDWLNGDPAASNAKIKSRLNSLRWDNTYATESAVFNAGLESNRLTFDNDGTISKRQADAVYGTATVPFRAFSFQASVRHDRIDARQSSPFGNKTGKWDKNSGLLGLGYDMNDHWRLTVSTSTGFRAPSPGELSGNDQLQPESHRSVEAGVSHRSGNTDWRLLTFSTRTTNAISWVGNNTENVGKTNNQGIEFSGTTQLSQTQLTYSLTSQNPRNSETLKPLARRARVFAAVGVNHQWGKTRVGATVHTSGKRRDSDYSDTILAGYTTVDLNAERAIAPSWKLQAKLENLFDERYELASGYNTPRRGIFVTLKYAPK